jgi:non-canonical poly(A) RNA polymerase PAPD5/7
VLVLKHLLVLNDFNSAYTGGISSYALVLWALAYLKERETQDLGELLMGFLEYYGKEFDPKRVGIDLNGGKR